MKLKYKKIILITTMSTMGIGLLTLSITKDGIKKNSLDDSTNVVAEISNKSLGDNNSEEIDVLAANENETNAVFGIANISETEGTEGDNITPTPEPTPEPTPTPIPVYDLVENEEINTLFEDYYNAKSASDVDKIKTLYSDPSKVESVDELQSKVLNIEEYRNIKSYTKKGIEEGTYIVYVYHEIKFARINTLAPGLAKFYVITDENGEYKIFSSTMDDELKEYYDARNTDEDVIDLINKTNKKSEKAKESDEDLKEFWESLDSLVNKE